ncbi:hypothetical protein BGZ94_001736 [Podila epigama]|nr:hypothetical protein BGZ94_001736 [Podila epigama]
MSTANKFLTTFRHLTRTSTNTPRLTKPIVSAPMNGWSGPKLVAAVANNGGLPIYPIGYYTDPAKILHDLHNTQSLLHDIDPPAAALASSKQQQQFLPYAVGFITFWLDRQGPDLLLSILRGEGDTATFTNSGSTQKGRPPIGYWFSFGDYRPYLRLVREHGAPGSKVIVQVSTVTEAIQAQDDAVDVIVVQGTEAGGHGARKVSPLLTLLPEVISALEANNKAKNVAVPAVLAAGGISTNVQFRSVQDMGASGAVIGTGFMPTFESLGPQKAKERLLQTEDGGVNTVRTRIFDDLRAFDWPEPYDGRVVRNSVTDREEIYNQREGKAAKGTDSFKLLKRDFDGTKEDWTRANSEQDYDLLPLWSGTGVGLLKKQSSAADFMDELIGIEK